MPIAIEDSDFVETGATLLNAIQLANLNVTNVGDVILIFVDTRVETNPLGALTVEVLAPSGPDPTVNFIDQIEILNFVQGTSTTTNNLRVAAYWAIAGVTGLHDILVQTNTFPQEFIIYGIVLSGVDTAQNPSSATNSTGTGAAVAAVTGNVLTGDFIVDNPTFADSAATITPAAVPPIPILILQTGETTTGGSPLGMFSGTYHRTDTGAKVYFGFVSSQNATVSVGFFALPPICVAKDTSVLMADGTSQFVQYIQRGDLVAGDLSGTVSRVARVVKTRMPGITPISLVKISKNALGENQPHTDLTISSGHPILLGEHRYRAKCFIRTQGVKYYSRSKNTADKLLPVDDNKETYSLYNIQFEHDGYFVANGLVVDSVPVLSTKHPLPKELYFNPNLFNIKTEYPKPHLYKRI